jgi:hypothetical protein
MGGRSRRPCYYLMKPDGSMDAKVMGKASRLAAEDDCRDATATVRGHDDKITAF